MALVFNYNTDPSLTVTYGTPATTTASGVYTKSAGVKDFTFDVPDNVIPFDNKSKCDLMGHMMGREVEWADGGVLGKCEVCGGMIHGRRLPGGLAVSQLRELVHSSLDDHTDLEELSVEALRLQDLIDAEDRALEEARSLLALARRKIAQRALPNFE